MTRYDLAYDGTTPGGAHRVQPFDVSRSSMKFLLRPSRVRLVAERWDVWPSGLPARVATFEIPEALARYEGLTEADIHKGAR